MKEEHRRVAALTLAHVGWWGALALLVVNIAVAHPPKHPAPPWIGVTIVFLIGVAIAAGTALSRMKLARVIVQVFITGAQMGEEHRAYEAGLVRVFEAGLAAEREKLTNGNNGKNGKEDHS